jgi:hypothetical protein
MASPAKVPSPEQDLRWRSILEIVLVYGMIEAALWSEGPWRFRIAILTLLLVIAIGLLRRDLWPKLGLGWRGLTASLWLVPASAVLAGGILLVGHEAHTLHSPYGRFWYIAAAGYSIWALEQQYLLQSFFLVRFESLLGDNWLALAAAVSLFCFAHVPNPILMAGTLLMAVVFCLLFRSYRNIYALALAHAMFGLSVAATFPESVIRHMRVGIGYLHYVKR